jgi:predicted RND superfamily exporter protein
LVRGQLAGLALTLACLFATIAIAFRSVLLGFLGMLPNLLPCLVIYGLMGAAGRPLSVATAMIGSVMLGLVVDDTIHFLYRFRVARAGGTSVTRSLARAIVHAGRPVVITSLVLSVGFAAGLAGNLETTREFSALAAATILGALAADLVLLPALLFALARPRPRQRPRRRRTALHGVLQPCPSLTST